MLQLKEFQSVRMHRLFSRLASRTRLSSAIRYRSTSAGQLLTLYTEYNIIYSGLVPLILILISTLLIHPSSTRNRYHKSHVTILGLLISLILTSFITDVIKNAVGRPRPDLLATCKPAKGTAVHQLVTIDVCTEKDHHVLHDGWRSFPSGHSSFAFSGLGYLGLCVTLTIFLQSS